jgi:hypothetical protein
MKVLLAAAVAAFALSSVAIAAEPAKPTQPTKSGPVKMSDQELDKVAAGALITVIAVDVVDVNNNKVAIPVAANVAAGILCAECTATQTARPGRINQ